MYPAPLSPMWLSDGLVIALHCVIVSFISVVILAVCALFLVVFHSLPRLGVVSILFVLSASAM